MIGQNNAATAASPVCEVRSTGETSTVPEMQRWLCDRHVRRELALLAKLLPSYDATVRDAANSDTGSAADNSGDVRDVSEEWEPPMGSSTVSHTEAKPTTNTDRNLYTETGRLQRKSAATALHSGSLKYLHIFTPNEFYDQTYRHCIHPQSQISARVSRLSDWSRLIAC